MEVDQNIVLLRNYWEFAAVSQFLHTFYEVFGLETFDTETLERDLASNSRDLTDLYIRLMRTLTQNRFINTDNWQHYLAKEHMKRDAECPLGTPEDLTDFYNLEVRSKLTMLHNLCEWQLDDPERFRQHVKDEEEAFQWRVDPIGWDAKGNTYWLFDDNRLYRELLPKPKSTPKSKSKKSRRRSTRSSGRIKSNGTLSEDEGDQTETNGHEDKEELLWETLCCTITEWETFPERFQNSKHSYEKSLYRYLRDDIRPKVLEVLRDREKTRKMEEALQNRKRSSRILVRELERKEQQKQEEQQRRNLEELEAKKKEEKEQAQRQKLALEREQRLRERELRLFKRESASQTPEPITPQPVVVEPIESTPPAKVTQNSTKSGSTGRKSSGKKTGRGRGRRRKTETREESWKFDCVCGLRGKNIDDGTPLIACEQCNVWQHIACLQKQEAEMGLPITQDWENVDYICRRCKRASMVDKTPSRSSESKKPVKIKLNMGSQRANEISPGAIVNHSPTKRPSYDGLNLMNGAGEKRPRVDISPIRQPVVSHSLPHLSASPYSGMEMASAPLVPDAAHFSTMHARPPMLSPMQTLQTLSPSQRSSPIFHQHSSPLQLQHQQSPFPPQLPTNPPMNYGMLPHGMPSAPNWQNFMPQHQHSPLQNTSPPPPPISSQPHLQPPPTFSSSPLAPLLPPLDPGLPRPPIMIGSRLSAQSPHSTGPEHLPRLNSAVNPLSQPQQQMPMMPRPFGADNENRYSPPNARWNPR
ncbi:uncharacterized protein VTP21DRAFT_10077 [Calcarisporiella thermophila]|uniref:uncharacterized protein n=1 Tax=Calcarisporiella thermophila TaxID=911321 RepID=UPI003742B6FA